MNWINVNEYLPPAKDDYYSFTESENVMATDGEEIYICRAQRWSAEDGEDARTRWVIRGPDSYHFFGVTHWAALPALPNAQGEPRR